MCRRCRHFRLCSASLFGCQPTFASFFCNCGSSFVALSARQSKKRSEHPILRFCCPCVDLRSVHKMQTKQCTARGSESTGILALYASACLLLPACLPDLHHQIQKSVDMVVVTLGLRRGGDNTAAIPLPCPFHLDQPHQPCRCVVTSDFYLQVCMDP